MKIIATLLVLFVALSHVGILVLEMFYWTTPFAEKAFLMTQEALESSKKLALNQGLYNGFLAAGLFWGLFTKRVDLKVFFLGCVIVAGVFGALTVKPAIVLTQAAPALLALIFVLLSPKKSSY